MSLQKCCSRTCSSPYVTFSAAKWNHKSMSSIHITWGTHSPPHLPPLPLVKVPPVFISSAIRVGRRSRVVCAWPLLAAGAQVPHTPLRVPASVPLPEPFVAEQRHAVPHPRLHVAVRGGPRDHHPVGTPPALEPLPQAAVFRIPEVRRSVRVMRLGRGTSGVPKDGTWGGGEGRRVLADGR